MFVIALAAPLAARANALASRTAEKAIPIVFVIMASSFPIGSVRHSLTERKSLPDFAANRRGCAFIGLMPLNLE
ncbi:MAG: hypothetical protein ABR863_07325 [Roseiarcus sp.]